MRTRLVPRRIAKTMPAIAAARGGAIGAVEMLLEADIFLNFPNTGKMSLHRIGCRICYLCR
jgi:hypothetical protein